MSGRTDGNNPGTTRPSNVSTALSSSPVAEMRLLPMKEQKILPAVITHENTRLFSPKFTIKSVGVCIKCGHEFCCAYMEKQLDFSAQSWDACQCYLSIWVLRGCNVFALGAQNGSEELHKCEHTLTWMKEQKIHLRRSPASN